MHRTIATTLALALAVSAPAALAQNKLGNSKLKDKGYERLEGRNAFKVGCRHIIRSEDRETVYHPTVLKNDEIGLDVNGRYLSVTSADKTKLRGGGKVTVWRTCRQI